MMYNQTNFSYKRISSLEDVTEVIFWLYELHCDLDLEDCVSGMLLRLISVTVFSFTHPPILSALLLILSASRSFITDFQLLFLMPFPSPAPLHGRTFPFLSNRNPLWTPSNTTLKHFFFSKTIGPPCFPSHTASILLCASACVSA